MPVYEYKCKSCGEKFEVRCSLQDQEKEPKCPKCGSHDTQRVFGSFGSTSSTSSCGSEPTKLRFG